MPDPCDGESMEMQGSASQPYVLKNAIAICRLVLLGIAKKIPRKRFGVWERSL
jgi:hypothetical protein